MASNAPLGLEPLLSMTSPDNKPLNDLNNERGREMGGKDWVGRQLELGRGAYLPTISNQYRQIMPASINYNIKRQYPPSAFQRLSFWLSLHYISTYV